MKPYLLLLFSIFSAHAIAQGCSDAGICSIGDMHYLKEDSMQTDENKLSVILTSGRGDEGVFIFTPAIQYEKQTSAHLTFQTKITGNYASGNLGTAAGAGDFFLSARYTLNPSKKLEHTLLLGTKLPLNTGDLKAGIKPLPMQYQSSLGTIDLIVGLVIKYNKMSINASWQQPLSGRNRNTFLPQYWNTEAAYKYSSSNDFNRRGDVLLSYSYQLISSKKWFWQASIVGIYHLNEDTYIDANTSISPIKLSGSKGLTVNIASRLLCNLSGNLFIGVTVASPIVVREIRPDGLTRSFVFSPELNFNF